MGTMYRSGEKGTSRSRDNHVRYISCKHKAGTYHEARL